MRKKHSFTYKNLSIQTLKEPGMIRLLSFLVPVVILLVLFVIRGIYPFGDRSFLYSDMYHQYMPFFSEFMRKVKAGEGITYSYNVGIGSNFLALYVYYLASPLHWLAFLLPEAYLMEFMSYLTVIKLGLCGLTAAYYLQKRFGESNFGIIFFACFYALSGFTAAYNWNIMWLDCVILLPLIVLGLEQLAKEGRCGLYCITLALSIFTNYYISIMICIFLVLYFGVLLVTEKRNFRIVGNFALYSLLAGGMAGILLIPEVCAIIVTDFGDMDFPEKLESYFSVLDMLARHCMCISAERGLDHWPNIYCGVAVFLLLPMYALNQKLSIRKRFMKLALAGVMLLGFSTNMLDFIWHGMNYPDSLPGRQSFIYIFLILVMCYEAYTNLKETEPKQILNCYLGTVVFILFVEKFVESDDFSVRIEFLTLGFVTIYAMLLWMYRTKEGARAGQMIGMLALVAVIAESCLNMGWTSIGTVSRSGYLGQQEDYRNLYEYAREFSDDEFFRVEKFTRKTKNDGTLTGYPTASVFSSTMNSHVMDMYQKLGMRHSKVYYGFDGATGLTAALLNVQYMFGESDQYEGSMYRLLESSGDIYLYESLYKLPFGYVAPVGFDLQSESRNGIQNQNQLAKELVGGVKLFDEVSSKASGDDVKFTAGEDGIYYARLTASGTGKVEAKGGCLGTQSFNDLKNESLLYLGELKKGNVITLTNGDEKDETPKISAKIYKMDLTVLEYAMKALSEQYLTDVVYDSTGVSGKLKLEKAGRLILSIPYETGWTVRINGEKITPGLFAGTLMAFDLEPGEYELEMQYVPAGKWAGIGVSAVSVPVFALLMWYRRRSVAKRSRCLADA